MKTHSRTAVALLALSLTAASIMGCAPKAAPAPSPTLSASPTPTPSATPAAAEAVSPLRGTPVAASKITGPALSAKIDNHWAARPQWGLDYTDLVYEELVEGGLTRYLAVWFSDVPAEIGPVRSIRPMDPDIAVPLGGIIAFSGGKAKYVAMVERTSLHAAIHGGTDDKFMYRSSEKVAPHNVVLKAQEIRKAYSTLKPPQQQFTYASDAAGATAATQGVAAKGLDLTYSYQSHRSWRWDAASHTYLRSQDGKKDMAADGKRLSATNVVAMQVSVTYYGEVPRSILVASGKAWVATGGKVLQGTWTKKSQSDPIHFLTTDGKPLNLAPGNTWIQLVPTSGSTAVVK